MWITGASSGIGEALALDLAVAGAKLAISGTNAKRLEEVKEKCLSKSKLKPNDVLCVPFDVTDLSCHQEQVKKVLQHFNCIDVLVNNAGRSLRAMMHETAIEIDQELFQVNVFGVVNLSRLVLNHWYNTKWKGHFVVTSSTTGKAGVVNAGAYCATKHALHGYFECEYCKNMASDIINNSCVVQAFVKKQVHRASKLQWPVLDQLSLRPRKEHLPEGRASCSEQNTAQT